jgi:hypothetical protein
MAGDEDRRAANVHGILVWCIGLIAGALFLTGTMATGALSAGAASSGNLGAAQRAMGGAVAARPGAPMDARQEARQDEAARRAAAGTGGAALGAIAGLLGAVVGAGLATRRREGRGLGWRIALERRDEARAGRHERYAGTAPMHDERAPRVPATPAGTPPEVGGETRDPYHH